MLFRRRGCPDDWSSPGSDHSFATSISEPRNIYLLVYVTARGVMSGADGRASGVLSLQLPREMRNFFETKLLPHLADHLDLHSTLAPLMIPAVAHAPAIAAGFADKPRALLRGLPRLGSLLSTPKRIQNYSRVLLHGGVLLLSELLRRVRSDPQVDRGDDDDLELMILKVLVYLVNTPSVAAVLQRSQHQSSEEDLGSIFWHAQSPARDFNLESLTKQMRDLAQQLTTTDAARATLNRTSAILLGLI